MSRSKEINAWVLKQKDCWDQDRACFDNLKLLRACVTQGLDYDPVEITMASHFAKYDVYDLRREGKW